MAKFLHGFTFIAVADLHRFIFTAVAASWLWLLSFMTLTMENPLIMAPQLEGYPWPFKGSTCQAKRKNPTREAARFCRNTWTTLKAATTHTESSQTGYQLYFYFLCLSSKWNISGSTSTPKLNLAEYRKLHSSVMQSCKLPKKEDCNFPKHQWPSSKNLYTSKLVVSGMKENISFTLHFLSNLQIKTTWFSNNEHKNSVPSANSIIE